MSRVGAKGQRGGDCKYKNALPDFWPVARLSARLLRLSHPPPQPPQHVQNLVRAPAHAQHAALYHGVDQPAVAVSAKAEVGAQSDDRYAPSIGIANFPDLRSKIMVFINSGSIPKILFHDY